MGMGTQKRGRRRSMSEINVTPFVDVMLVLLIIFMVTAPMLTTSVAVNLPEAGSGAATTVEKPVVVSIQENNTLYVGDTPVTSDTLAESLRKATKNDLTKIVQLRADKELNYGALMAVMDTMRDAGFTKIALITTP